VAVYLLQGIGGLSAPANLIEKMSSIWWTFSLCTLLYFSPGTKPRFPRGVFEWDNCKRESRMSVRQFKFQKESVMAGLYLGVAVTGLNALVAMAVMIAFM
jgi:hypothetical protein